MSPVRCLHRLDGLAVVSANDRGRAVVAARPFARGQTVCSCPVIVLPSEEEVPNTVLHNYYLYWDESRSAIACGYVQLLNHSDTPNLQIVRHIDEQTIEAVALRDIRPGEELTVRYVCGAWFPASPPLSVQTELIGA